MKARQEAGILQPIIAAPGTPSTSMAWAASLGSWGQFFSLHCSHCWVGNGTGTEDSFAISPRNTDFVKTIGVFRGTGRERGSYRSPQGRMPQHYRSKVNGFSPWEFLWTHPDPHGIASFIKPGTQHRAWHWGLKTLRAKFKAWHVALVLKPAFLVIQELLSHCNFFPGFNEI